jgi:hypothetical protein
LKKAVPPVGAARESVGQVRLALHSEHASGGPREELLWAGCEFYIRNSRSVEICQLFHPNDAEANLFMELVLLDGDIDGLRHQFALENQAVTCLKRNIRTGSASRMSMDMGSRPASEANVTNGHGIIEVVFSLVYYKCDDF